MPSPDEPEPNVSFGDGQFDRFSAARRTRRYKRAPDTTDVTSPEFIAETHIVKPSSLQIENSRPIIVEPEIDKESRLKAWQDRLKIQSDSTYDCKASGKRSRNHSRINQDDVNNALQLKSSSPIDIVKPKCDIISAKISRTYINPGDTIEAMSRKGKEHDNDEGFEESQSLMSESPSQGNILRGWFN